MELINNLVIFRANILEESLMPLASFRALLDNLEFERNETFAFKYDLIGTIYRRPIKQLDRFYFKGKTNNYLDPDALAVIEWSLSMPVQRVDWKRTTECLKSKDLPPFFANKTQR